MGHFVVIMMALVFITVGKGNKERMITVSDAMLAALKRYRYFFRFASDAFFR